MDERREHGAGRGGDARSEALRAVRDDSEIDARAIVRFGIGLGIVIAAVLGATWLLAVAFKARSVAHDPPPSPLSEARAHRRPPEPRLQPSPREDLAAMRAEENAQLRGYGWVDRGAGIARIPVDRAVEILLEQGLPVVTLPKPPAQPQPEAAARADSSSGDAAATSPFDRQEGARAARRKAASPAPKGPHSRRRVG